MEKINCILLVDDDPTTNFLNNELLTDLEICNHINIAHNGQEALDYINLKGSYRNKKRKNYPLPNLMFLDINMPLMDGFEVLEEFDKLGIPDKDNPVIIVFLTTSDANKDKIKSTVSNLVYDFIEKPLRKNDLLTLLDTHFKLTPK